ncbi:MAG: 16S rRNA (cytosine(1402)-N(4))-methyltransferase RsmH [Gammaproteobacteria bacterium]
MQHRPVLYEEALEALAIEENGIYFDCTFGRGGHSRGILERLGNAGRLFSLDRDKDAITSDAAQALSVDPRFTLLHSRFSRLENIADEHGLAGRVAGVLLDLGVSSPQLDNPERGFSFINDGPLDMRMDADSGVSAAQWLARVDEKELTRVLFEYGEERFARRIAKAVVTERNEQPLLTTRQLAELIERTVPFKERHKHPATRCFQALRIAINHELEELEQSLVQAVNVLKPGGRLVVIAFHSLEDRIVKRFISAEAGAKNDPGRLPVKEADIAKGVLKKIGKAVKAGAEEVSANPRARSAVMRIAEKL